MAKDSQINGQKSPVPETTPEKSAVALREEEILKFWKEHDLFQKSLNKSSPKGNYVFYDGPPFATGLPHYGHILASAIKDAVPRYFTMNGYHVDRRWGWDTHGLPIENIVEKELKIAGKKQIEAFGIEKFNEHARSRVLEFVHDWKRTVERIARWVDFDGSYKTMDNSFIESVWWSLKEMNGKGLIYESTRVLPYCPRCETPIANSEIAMDNSYKDITDISVYAKFELKDQPKTYFLAWTTTPWTLPGNFALAVNPKNNYYEVTPSNLNPDALSRSVVAKYNFKEGEHYIAVKEFWARVGLDFEGKDSEIKLPDSGITFNAQLLDSGKIIGLSYTPLFPYFTSRNMPNKENAWKVYGADFVTTTDGTGIVHIAPGYGEDDMELARRERIPFIHHVTTEGKFSDDVLDFKGMPVKPKGDHQSADIEIIKYLAKAGSLFAKEKIIHSYPHCYRCETPLYYYALPAWFINIQSVKNNILKQNEKIHWIPEHLKEGRFKKSAEGAPDWNISRNRFWASPLPIWKCQECQAIEFLGSVADIKNKTRRNAYTLIRHGKAHSNIDRVLSNKAQAANSLTEEGKQEIRDAAKMLKPKKIDVIISSDFVRTKETAELIAESLSLPASSIVYDPRLREYDFGEFDGKSLDDWHVYWHSRSWEDVESKVPGGESPLDIHERIASCLYETDAAYEGKNILIVSHQDPLNYLQAAAAGEGLAAIPHEKWSAFAMKNAEIRDLDFARIPHNKKYELDLHRPYIDSISFSCACGGTMKRIPEVIDCWFESGSMPFAQVHYPFEKKEWFHDNFPSQFVAEYIAQTRTWFYYTLAISTILFNNIPFEHVVTTGTVLAEDGQKMSKSKGNFPDPWILFNKFGVDALRYYLLSSQLMRSEDLNFSEKDVDVIYKKLILRLDNVVSFYELYASADIEASHESPALLDQWIVARLAELAAEVTACMNAYEIDQAIRPFDLFIDDLSTWYIRRSRDRFKGDDVADKKNALATTRFVLRELAKLLAPFLPFMAEAIYQKVKDNNDVESVHLESWPIYSKKNAASLIADMAHVRVIVSEALEVRSKAGIKVRQPLSSLVLKNTALADNASLALLIKDEVNVKEIKGDASLEESVWLDTEVSVELKEEGVVRDMIRAIQDLRKKAGLNPSDIIVLAVDADDAGKALIEKFKKEIMKAAQIKSIEYKKLDQEEMNIGVFSVKFKVAV